MAISLTQRNAWSHMNATTHTHIAGGNVRRLTLSAWRFRRVANHILPAAPRAKARTLLRMTVVAVVDLCALGLLGSSSVAVQSSPGDQSGTNFIIGISPFLD